MVDTFKCLIMEDVDAALIEGKDPSMLAEVLEDQAGELRG